MTIKKILAKARKENRIKSGFRRRTLDHGVEGELASWVRDEYALLQKVSSAKLFAKCEALYAASADGRPPLGETFLQLPQRAWGTLGTFATMR